ncbi:MAG TPA: hypothetical protein VMI92_10440 [Steroidobacteraceae bacterium]|nr:hypothetical protein [Steroidobacteraceae bacterium]
MQPQSQNSTSGLYQIPFLVGITGHRDLVAAEVPQIRAELRRLLLTLQERAPQVRIQLLSALAEGADLLASDVALDLGMGVIALLPFEAGQCRAELKTDAARASFDRALAQAERVELPGATGAARSRQFQRAGTVVARYSSLLIAVWNGAATPHPAGTARVVDLRRRGLPPPQQDREPRADPLLGASGNDLLYEIRCSRVSAPAEPGARVSAPGFSAGSIALGSLERGLPSALCTLLERTGAFNRDVIEYGGRIATHGRRLSSPTPFATPESLLYMDRLFVAADWLGVYFRRCYTRALRARYALWALLAFLLLAFKKEHDSRFGLASIVGVLIIFGLGGLLARWAHRRSWQRRYLDYRALAEGLRVDFFWELAGVRARFEEEFAHESFLQSQDEELEWIRAAMRAVSLRCAMLPAEQTPHGFAQAFAGWIGEAHPTSGAGQLQYYRARATQLARRQEIAEGSARCMLFGGLAVGVLLAVDAACRQYSHALLPDSWTGALLWALALLTVYGAIFEIYLGEKADRALIRQYRYMDSLFSFAAQELRSARSDADKLEILRSLGHACLAEHAEWILAHRDKRIEGMRW